MTRLEFPNCLNARDLGGLGGTGGVIRPRALIRTDGLHRLTDEGVRAVRAYGVGRIVDLRSAREIDLRPNPFLGDPVYLHQPYIDEDQPVDLRAETLLSLYVGGLARNGRFIAAALAAIAEAPPGGVLVHCAAGKDRTGVIVAMILDLVGVDRDTIAADYALTTENLRTRHVADLEAETDPTKRERLRDLQTSEPETILATLEHLDQGWGSTATFLASFGVTPTQISALSARLIDA